MNSEAILRPSYVFWVRNVCLGMQGLAFEHKFFPLQGDRVIGVSNLNAMAEECITDQKVYLPLSAVGHIDSFFSFVLFSFCVSLLTPPSFCVFHCILFLVKQFYFLLSNAQMLNFCLGAQLHRPYIEFCLCRMFFFFKCLSNWLAIHLDPI